MARKFICFLLCLFVFLDTSFCAEKYLTNSQIADFVSAYNDYFGTSLPTTFNDTSFDLTSKYYSGVILTHNVNSKGYDAYFLGFLTDGNISLQETTYKDKEMCFEYLDGDYIFKYEYQVGTSLGWKKSSKDRTTLLCYKGEALVSSNVSVINLNNSLFYTYSFVTKDFTEQINSINTDLNALTNQVNTLQTDVNNINSGLEGTSEKLDTIITNQDKLYQDTNKTSNDFASAFPSVDIDDPTQSTFETVSNGITSAFTSTSPVSISFTFRGTPYTISSEQISVKDPTILGFLTIVCNFGLTMILIKDLRREIQKVQEGKIEQIGNDDISANMV